MVLDGGMPVSRDLVLAHTPTDPEVRESVSMWISDAAGAFGFPRFVIEAIGSQWLGRGIQANIAFPDGRVLIGGGGGTGTTSIDEHGDPTILDAGPLQFRCVEPFHTWTMTYRGRPVDTTAAEQIVGRLDGPRPDVEIDVTATMAVPPWVQGEMSADAATRLTGEEGRMMGGERYEQLFRCTGALRIAGEPERAFEGTGLRIHRVGVRDTAKFTGHCWMSALFPSGKAFGFIVYPDGDDGTAAYNEGFVYDGSRMIPARVVRAPWLTTYYAGGGPVDSVLETADGTVEIAGHTHDSTFVPKGASLFPGWQVGGQDHPAVRFNFHQGGARYTWDGESTYGMIERSLRDGPPVTLGGIPHA